MPIQSHTEQAASGLPSPTMVSAETLDAACQRISALEAALRGMLGLAQLLSHNRDLPASLREVLLANHRILDARELLR